MMENKTYEQRVQEIAEEMAAAENEHLDVDCRVCAGEFYQAARIALKHMAVEFAAGFNHIYDFTVDPVFGPDIVSGQIERGLIPSPENKEDPSGHYAMGPRH